MQIAIASPQPKRKLELGDVIVAKHLKTSKALYYQLIRLGTKGKFYLLNLSTNMIMESFESIHLQSAIDYVEVAVKAKIMEIVPSSKLTLTLGQIEPLVLTPHQKVQAVEEVYRHIEKRFL